VQKEVPASRRWVYRCLARALGLSWMWHMSARSVAVCVWLRGCACIPLGAFARDLRHWYARASIWLHACTRVVACMIVAHATSMVPNYSKSDQEDSSLHNLTRSMCMHATLACNTHAAPRNCASCTPDCNDHADWFTWWECNRSVAHECRKRWNAVRLRGCACIPMCMQAYTSYTMCAFGCAQRHRYARISHYMWIVQRVIGVHHYTYTHYRGVAAPRPVAGPVSD